MKSSSLNVRFANKFDLGHIPIMCFSGLGPAHAMAVGFSDHVWSLEEIVRL